MNDDGGTATADDFSLSGERRLGAGISTADGQNDLGGQRRDVQRRRAGWRPDYATCVRAAARDDRHPDGGTATLHVHERRPACNDDRQEGRRRTTTAGRATAVDFAFQVNGGQAQAFEADGQNDLTVDAGTYSVTEPAASGYSTTYHGLLGHRRWDRASRRRARSRTTTSLRRSSSRRSSSTTTAARRPQTTSRSRRTAARGAVVRARRPERLTVDAGTYTVTEPRGRGLRVDVRQLLAGRRSRRRHRRRAPFTNDDQPATLIVKKVVVTTTAGRSRRSDFSFKVNGGQAHGVRCRRPDRPDGARRHVQRRPSPRWPATRRRTQGCADILLRVSAETGDLHRHEQRRAARSGLHRRPEVGQPDDREGAGRTGDLLGDDHEHVGRRRRGRSRTSSTTSSATSTTTAATAASTSRSTSPRARR